jgi:hypothetical protein
MDPTGEIAFLAPLAPYAPALVPAMAKACAFVGSAGLAAYGLVEGGSRLMEQSSQEESESKEFDEDQKAAVELAKEAKKKGGLAEDEAEALVEQANDVGVPSRGPESHPNRPHGKEPHVHVGPVNHIPVRRP